MLKEISIECPACGEETVVAVASPEPGSDAAKVSTTSCRHCKARVLAMTQPDGTVGLGLFDSGAESPGAFVATVTEARAFELDDIMRIPYGIWKPRGEEIGDFQHRPEWAAALETSLKEAQARPRPLSVPRRIFLSYRWGDPEEDAWVERLYSELEARGNQVVFDRKAASDENPPSVPDLVARIASCHVFLAVLDPGFVERVAAGESGSVQEGWVTDEFYTALAFGRKDLLLVMGLLRDGDEMPSAFRPFAQGSPGNTFDVREEGALGLTLDRFFVQFGESPREDVAGRAALALHESREAFDAGDAPRALERADAACALVPALADGHAQRARVAYRCKKPDEALRDARRALAIDPNLEEMLIFGAAAANEVHEWHEAAQLAREALERDRSHANAHYLLGKALTELDQVDPGLAHFAIARRSNLDLTKLYNDGGWAWRRAGEPARALEWYRAGLARTPDQPALLTNATAAAIEAGRATEALELLQRLSDASPEAPELADLDPDPRPLVHGRRCATCSVEADREATSSRHGLVQRVRRARSDRLTRGSVSAQAAARSCPPPSIRAPAAVPRARWLPRSRSQGTSVPTAPWATSSGAAQQISGGRYRRPRPEPAALRSRCCSAPRAGSR